MSARVLADDGVFEASAVVPVAKLASATMKAANLAISDAPANLFNGTLATAAGFSLDASEPFELGGHHRSVHGARADAVHSETGASSNAMALTMITEGGADANDGEVPVFPIGQNGGVTRPCRR